MRNILFATFLAVGVGSTLALASSQMPVRQTQPKYDGAWWLASDSGERSGFINGVADCMTWEASKKGYSATPEQLSGKITAFYESNSQAKNISVLEAWRRVLPSQKEISVTGGEKWNNPHWYLNGDWWGQESKTEQLGFVEGFLWCMSTQVQGVHASYSNNPDFYQKKINTFVRANPKLGSESVATTLARFKDANK